MRTFEAIATIADDRKLVVQLPQDVVPGEHNVVVLLDSPASSDELSIETPIRLDDGLLVYDGEIAGPIEDVVAELRDERMRHLMTGWR